MAIEWTPEYSVGVDIFDEHHKKLFGIANNLLESYQAGELTEVRKIAVQLREYTLYHFDAEEDAMRQYDYPKMGAHVKEHEEFKKFVVEAFDELDTLTKETLAIKTSFLFKWITEHIGKSDKACGEYYKSIGIVIT